MTTNYYVALQLFVGDLFQVKRLLDSEKNMQSPKKGAQKRKKNSPQSSDVQTSQGSNGSVKETGKKEVSQNQREMEQRERETIVLWRSPITTVQFFVFEAGVLLAQLGSR